MMGEKGRNRKHENQRQGLRTNAGWTEERLARAQYIQDERKEPRPEPFPFRALSCSEPEVFRENDNRGSSVAPGLAGNELSPSLPDGWKRKPPHLLPWFTTPSRHVCTFCS
ncbi:hypothetical protein MTO96_024839 [Rhipicephalus appendiculatus]